ncbi:MAG TPA: type I pullulanase [Candidatus Xenobia bacterium]|jgi:pullulanase
MLKNLLALILLVTIPAIASLPTSTQPLGALYTPAATVFRVWAPTASQVMLHGYRLPQGGKGEVHAMARHPDGTWDYTIHRDCRGLYYTFSASGANPRFRPQDELVDPYAEAATAWNGRGIVMADRTALVPRPDFPAQDAVIYEMHVRDFTVDPAARSHHPGKFLGLVERGTPGGLDHLLALGINTVQLMPVQTFAGRGYGWGYDAALYNAPEARYAETDAVREFKEMVNDFHRHGIRVVMDVVYTHTAQEVYDRQGSFEGLVPGYYFRHKPGGSLWNGSGCGNEFRSEAPMARRFLLDSLRHWVVDYGVDGFRFDLMGLLDMETVRQVAAELHTLDPNLLICGEPWTAGDTPVRGMAKGRQRGLGVAVFNDHFRDALRGDVFHPKEPGFLEAGLAAEAVQAGMMGSIDDFCDSPLETVNYIECHDNHTLWDRLALSAPDSSEADRIAMDKLGAAILLTSPGIPFLGSGQEFLRSKGGDDNSYDKGDSVNMIHWPDQARHADVFEWYRTLLRLRREHPVLRPSTAAQVRLSTRWLKTPAQVIGCVRSKGSDTLVLLFNGSDQEKTVALPTGSWVAELKQASSWQTREARLGPHGVLILSQPSALP